MQLTYQYLRATNNVGRFASLLAGHIAVTVTTLAATAYVGRDVSALTAAVAMAFIEPLYVWYRREAQRAIEASMQVAFLRAGNERYERLDYLSRTGAPVESFKTLLDAASLALLWPLFDGAYAVIALGASIVMTAYVLTNDGRTMALSVALLTNVAILQWLIWPPDAHHSRDSSAATSVKTTLTRAQDTVLEPFR